MVNIISGVGFRTLTAFWWLKYRLPILQIRFDELYLTSSFIFQHKKGNSM